MELDLKKIEGGRGWLIRYRYDGNGWFTIECLTPEEVADACTMILYGIPPESPHYVPL
jgi:hypothetical protein